MSTPGRRKALKALARRKRINQSRVNRGLAPLVKRGKKMVKTTAGVLGIKKR
jgi:hypothetical protein